MNPECVCVLGRCDSSIFFNLLTWFSQDGCDKKRNYQNIFDHFLRSSNKKVTGRALRVGSIYT